MFQSFNEKNAAKKNPPQNNTTQSNLSFINDGSQAVATEKKDVSIFGWESQENWIELPVTHQRLGEQGTLRMVGDFIWFGPLKRFQKLLMHTPLVNVFIFGSEAYHDYYRWPVKDRRIFELWKQHTPWGHLFAQYRGETQPRGPEALSSAG